MQEMKSYEGLLIYQALVLCLSFPIVSCEVTLLCRPKSSAFFLFPQKQCGSVAKLEARKCFLCWELTVE